MESGGNKGNIQNQKNNQKTPKNIPQQKRNNPNNNNNPTKMSNAGYGDNSSALEDFLSDNNTRKNYNQNNYGMRMNNNANFNQNSYGNNYNNNNYYGSNNYNQYGRNGMNQNNNYQNNNYQYNNNNQYNNYQNKNYQNNNNQYKQNNNMNNQPNNNKQNSSRQQSNNNPQYNQQQNQMKQRSNTQPYIKTNPLSQKSNNNTNQNTLEDIYPNTQEKMYHKLKEMKSLTVLEEEIALCDKIISIKQKKGSDYDEWKMKKELAIMQLNNTKSVIETGKMDFNTYKKIIFDELKYEQKILSFTKMDKKSKPNELQEIKRRIERRIEVIKKELSQKEEPEEPQTSQKLSENNNNQKIKIPNNIKQNNNNNKNTIPGNSMPLDSDVSNNNNQINRSKMPTNNIQLTNKVNNRMNSPKNQNYQKNNNLKNQPLSQTPKSNNQNQNQKVPMNKINEEDRNRLRKYIDGLIHEYTAAQAYFKKYHKNKQEADANQKLKLIYDAKKIIESPYYKNIPIQKVPKPITPEYIYGYSTEERTKRFKEILTEYIKQKSEIEQRTKSFIEKLQKLNKKKLEEVKAVSKEKLDADKAQKEKLIKIIENFKEKFKDKWTPAPECKKKLVDEKVEKISYENCQYALKIHAGKTNYDKDNIILRAIINLGENNIFQKQIQLKKEGDFDEEWVWKFSSEQWRILPKKFLEIEIDRDYWYKSEDKKGSGKIDLNNIKRNEKISGDYDIELISGRIKPKVKIDIIPILPQGNKITEMVKKERLEVTMVYSSFTGKSEATSIDPLAPSTNNSTTKNEMPQKQMPKGNISNNNKNNNNVNNNNLNKNNNVPKGNNVNNNSQKLKVDKSMFSQEELNDVDVVENLNSIKVLEFKIKELEARIAKIDGRTPRELLTKKVKMNCKKKIIEEQMGDGTISPKDYMELLQNQLLHDKALATYLKESNQNDKAKTVLGRVVLLNQEITELKQFMK